jgi:hypothetical protein
MGKKDELAKLKARVEELERATKPATPFVPEPWAPVDYTAKMTMPRAAMAEMVRAVPDDVVRNIAMRDARAPQTPSIAGIPSSQPLTGVRPGGGGTSGWVDARPLSNPPGTYMVDAIAIADDVRQRAGKK